MDGNLRRAKSELAGADVERVLTAGAYDRRWPFVPHLRRHRGQARCVARRVHQVRAQKCPVWVLCHEYRRSKRRCATVREMKEVPSGSAIRSLIPSHRKLPSSKAMAGLRKRRDKIPAVTVERGERKRTVDEVSKADSTMPKPGSDYSSGISLGDDLRLPRRHPACRRREAQPGCTEREDLETAMAREKAQAAPTARPKVPMRRLGADCFVVATEAG